MTPDPTALERAYQNVIRNGAAWDYCDALTAAEKARRPVQALAQATLQAYQLLCALEGWQPEYLDVPLVRQQLHDALTVAGHIGYPREDTP